MTKKHPPPTKCLGPIAKHAENSIATASSFSKQFFLEETALPWERSWGQDVFVSDFASIEFVVQPFQDQSWSGVVPSVGGMSLLDLILEFERRSGFDAPGEYGPLTNNPGSTRAYYLGETDDWCCGEREVALLGCSCGETGCWPLCCRIEASQDTVTWSGFAQPFQPQRSYDGFGPFVFDRGEYEEALAALARAARSR